MPVPPVARAGRRGTRGPAGRRTCEIDLDAVHAVRGSSSIATLTFNVEHGVARPADTELELGVRARTSSAPHAAHRYMPSSWLETVLAGEGRLGALATEDLVLLGGQVFRATASSDFCDQPWKAYEVDRAGETVHRDPTDGARRRRCGRAPGTIDGRVPATPVSVDGAIRRRGTARIDRQILLQEKLNRYVEHVLDGGRPQRFRVTGAVDRGGRARPARGDRRGRPPNLTPRRRRTDRRRRRRSWRPGLAATPPVD